MIELQTERSVILVERRKDRKNQIKREKNQGSWIITTCKKVDKASNVLQVKSSSASKISFEK